MTLSEAAVDLNLELHRRELTGYCYRMLGSSFDAEDAVQDTMIHALRAVAHFEQRSTHRSWLYRIATNVCLDMLRGRSRRAVPVELGPPRPPVAASLKGVLPENSWVSPITDERVLPAEADPAQLVELRESVRLAFVAALQHLPAKQRAVLILCDVLRWKAAEVADLLDTTVPSVNSALQRARGTLADTGLTRQPTLSVDQQELLASYVTAFERYDIERFVSLLREDAVQTMPPLRMWLRGAADIGAWMLGVGSQCRGSRVLPTKAANGCPAFGQYRRDHAGKHVPWALHVLDIVDGRIAQIDSFLDVERLFPSFGLPAQLG